MINERLFDVYNDIIDWKANQLSDRDFDVDMLTPLVKRYFKEAVEKFNGDESQFEDFADKYITLRISKYKMSNGESFEWSEEKMERELSMEEEGEKEEDTEY